jgi:hypothetical protein
MNNRSLVREDHVLRYRLFVDVEAGVFDSFRVELLEQQSMLIHGVSVDAAWREALAALSMMRAEYNKAPIRDPLHFQPFAIITACEFARESTKVGLQVNMLACNGPGPEPDARGHEDRVRALCTALDQIDFLRRRPKVAVH